ncbi:MAG TPA: hypothetical protein VFJ47_14770, partial [Terriglobales bacterium]|nr:hypothetical protein [Terriglobales bacterium]
LWSQLLQHWQPVGYMEDICVQKIAICLWKDRRALLWELRQQREAVRVEWAVRRDANPFSDSLSEAGSESSAVDPEMPPEILIGQEMPALHELTLLIRYGSANHHQLQQTITFLKELQGERKEKSAAAGISVSVKEEKH